MTKLRDPSFLLIMHSCVCAYRGHMSHMKCEGHAHSTTECYKRVRQCTNCSGRYSLNLFAATNYHGTHMHNSMLYH